MLRIIGKLLLLGALAVMLKFALLVALRRYVPDYMAESVVKEARLHAPNHNRVILIGGSGVAFGTDSAAISGAVSRPVVNMGLHGGLGLEYMLREAADGIRPGDLAVLIPEYELLASEHSGSGPELLLRLQFNPRAARYLGWWDWWLAARVIALSNRKSANAMLVGIRHGSAYQPVAYSAHSFNPEGDAVAHLDQPHVRLLEPYGIGPPDSHVVATVAGFCSRVRSSGADCVLVFPALAQSHFTLNRPQIEKIASALSAAVPAISTPDEWVYPDSWFFDTVYHASRAARQKRSERLGQVLNAYLQNHASQTARR